MLASEMTAFKTAREFTLAKIQNSNENANKESGKGTAEFFETVFNELVGIHGNTHLVNVAEKNKIASNLKSSDKTDKYTTMAALLSVLSLLLCIFYKYFICRDLVKLER